MTSTTLSGDGTTLATAEGYRESDSIWTENKVVTRNDSTGATLQEFEHEDKITTTCLSGNGKTLVTVEHAKLTYMGPKGDATVTIRNVDTGAKLKCRFSYGHNVHAMHIHTSTCTHVETDVWVGIDRQTDREIDAQIDG